MHIVAAIPVVAAFWFATTASTASAEIKPPPSLFDVIEMWLSANFDLLPAAKAPGLATLPAAKLVEIRYGLASGVAPGDVVAAYDGTSRTIFFQDGWSGHSPEELSVLVHEMVHHLQASADMRFACPGEREVLAYRAQDAWLRLFGMDLESAFGIDRGTLLVATACTN